MIKAICFDLGGTLLHIQGESFSSRLSKLVGIPLTEIRPFVVKYFYISSNSLNEAFTAFCKELGLNIHVVSGLLNSIQTSTSQISLYEDVLDTLAALKGYRLATISNSTPWESTNLMQLHLNNIFEVEINSYHVGFAKPDLRMFRYTEHVLKLAPTEIVIIGDSAVDDIMGAKIADWKTIHILRSNKNQQSSPYADIVVHSLWNLKNYIEEL